MRWRLHDGAAPQLARRFAPLLCPGGWFSDASGTLRVLSVRQPLRVRVLTISSEAGDEALAPLSGLYFYD